MKEDRGEICIFSPKREGTCRKTASPTGADGRIRTGDLILTKDALYLLSYISAVRISSNARIIILQRGAKSNTQPAKNAARPDFLHSVLKSRDIPASARGKKAEGPRYSPGLSSAIKTRYGRDLLTITHANAMIVPFKEGRES